MVNWGWIDAWMEPRTWRGAVGLSVAIVVGAALGILLGWAGS